MNWLDIIGILIIAFIIIGSVILDVIAIMDKEYELAWWMLCSIIVLMCACCIYIFLCL